MHSFEANLFFFSIFPELQWWCCVRKHSQSIVAVLSQTWLKILKNNRRNVCFHRFRVEVLHVLASARTFTGVNRMVLM